MTTYTPKLFLPLPAFDSTLWQDQYYEAMRIIDAAIGLFTSLPNFRGIWANSTAYADGDLALDSATAQIYVSQTAHTSASSGTFAEARTANPAYWRTFNPAASSRGTWAAATAYAINDFVLAPGTFGSVYAICVAAHTSTGVFADDLAAGYWSVLIDFGTSLTWGGVQTMTGADIRVAAPSVGANPATKTYVDAINAALVVSLAAKANLAGGAAFSGPVTAPTVALTSNDDTVATTAYVVAQVIATGLSLVLPGQAGNAGKFLGTDGSNANWFAVNNFDTYRNHGGL